MISFEPTHFNINKIKQASGLSFKTTVKNYRVYGLKKELYPIVINYDYDKLSESSQYRVNDIKEFFAKQGLSCCLDENPKYMKISIGLNKKIRTNIGLSVAIIQTIIYYLEGKMPLNNNVIFPKIAKVLL